VATQAASSAIPALQDDAARTCALVAPGATIAFHVALERVDALREDWSALATEASEPNPYAEPWFVAAALHHLGSRHVRLAEVREGGVLIGVLPLVVDGHYGRVPVRHVHNWRHHQSFLGTPLVRAGRERSFWRALIEGLDRAAWAPGFLHLRDLVEGGALHDALVAAAAELSRPAPAVYREVRAFLSSPLGATAYYEATIRKKKRKELARLRNRLAEEGPLLLRELGPQGDLPAWCDAFLQLERSGWKGREGSALACHAGTEHFFREALEGARDAGRLQFLALELNDHPVAMLVNFLTPPGSFSFKTAFDEHYARFSPGVLLQIDNLRVLNRPEIAWMDSCAAEKHPMINSLWAERRPLLRVTLPLSGARRRLAFATARMLESLSAAARRRRPQPTDQGDCS
jgi:CelD/BcsL family acetyltransferase involved in cellulose biosynthesis